MIDAKTLAELRKEFNQHGFEMIVGIYEENAELNHRLAQCNTENHNVHAENLKLWAVARAAARLRAAWIHHDYAYELLLALAALKETK